jgi:uncharacterized protein YukE
MATWYYLYRITIEDLQIMYASLPSEMNGYDFTKFFIKYPIFDENIYPQKLAKAYNLCLNSIRNKMSLLNNYIPKSSDFIEMESTNREFGIVIDLLLPKREFSYSQGDISSEYWETILVKMNEAVEKYNQIFENIKKALKDAKNEFLIFRTFYNTYINWEVTTTPTTTK